MDDYEEEEYFEEEIEEVETFEQETSYYVNLVNIPLDEYTIENKEFELCCDKYGIEYNFFVLRIF